MSHLQNSDRPQRLPSSPVHVKCEYGLKGCTRVAVYARVSTNNLSQELSLESQMTGFTSLINSRPDMELVRIYADEGVTGTSAAKRTQFLQMIRDAEAGLFDTIMTRSISRFARNTVECLEYVRRLKEIGINIFFQKENLDTSSVVSEMLLTVLAAFAQEESRSISENVKWGIRRRFEIGEARWCPTYGYRYEKEEIVVCRQEAAVVEEMFTLYLHGMSATVIANALNASQIPSPRGTAWTVTTVMQILKNVKYQGDMILQKYVTIDHMSHRSIINDRSSVPSYYVRNSHVPIIDRHTFGQVQRIAELKSPRGERSLYPYADAEIICPFCGNHMEPRLMHVQKQKRAICCFGEGGCRNFSVKTWMLDKCILSAFNNLSPHDIQGSGETARRMRMHLSEAHPQSVEYYFLDDLIKRILFSYERPAQRQKSMASWRMVIEWKCGIRSKVVLPVSHQDTEDPVHVAELYTRYLSRISSGEYIPAHPRNRRERIMAEERVVTER